LEVGSILTNVAIQCDDTWQTRHSRTRAAEPQRRESHSLCAHQPRRRQCRADAATATTTLPPLPPVKERAKGRETEKPGENERQWNECERTACSLQPPAFNTPATQPRHKRLEHGPDAGVKTAYCGGPQRRSVTAAGWSGGTQDFELVEFVVR
jgi:hypothetical protein